jgi:hypothetical protein
MILVYCDHISPRHRFIFDFIFGDVLGTDCELTANHAEFLDYNRPKLSYSTVEIPGGIHFSACNLLNETGIKQQDINVFRWKDLPVFFRVEEPSAVPFDPFALSFYLISRYEEYLPFEHDEHGRFRPELSLAYREGFLQIPLVDILANEIKKLIETKFPGLILPGHNFHFIPTVDIDIAFAHLGKGWPRAGAAWLKLLLKGDFDQIRERILTLSGKRTDPYDNFQLHLDLAGEYGHPLMYFALLGDFGKHDRNTRYNCRSFRELLMKLSLTADVGLHPSYRSYLQTDVFKKEKKRLEEITGKKVTKSRFHYLRLKFPDSYQNLLAEGITDDFSLGYSSMNGFRAGTCNPFYFYDLEKEEKTLLRLHPFIFMDSAMIDHLKMKPSEAVSEVKDLLEEVKNLGGEAIGIWHNYSLSEKDQYKGWGEVLVTILRNYKNLSK